MAANKVTYIGASLYPWQKAVTDAICVEPGSSKTVVLKAPRQLGKSFVCEQILLWYAINYAGTTNAMISPVLSQSRKVFREIINGIFDAKVVKKKNESRLEIELINGSVIFFKSGEQKDTLRGEHISGLLIWDEAAYLAQDIAELTLPWLQVAKANLLIASTPKVKEGLYFQYYQRGLEGDGVTLVDWVEYDTSEVLTEELKKEYRKVLTTNQYRSEIEGQFLDTDGMVFSNIKENATAIDDTVGRDFYVGIDFGSGGKNDYTSITVFNEKGEMKFLDYWNDLTTFQQIDRLATDLCIFDNKIRWINAENNSIGNALIDLLIKKLNELKKPYIVSKLNRWITSNSSKATLVTQFALALEQFTTKLFDDKLLISQLGSYEAEYNAKTQVITYNGASGTHDDLVMSTMLAWDAYITKNNKGNYSISVV